MNDVSRWRKSRCAGKYVQINRRSLAWEDTCKLTGDLCRARCCAAAAEMTGGWMTPTFEKLVEFVTLLFFEEVDDVRDEPDKTQQEKDD